MKPILWIITFPIPRETPPWTRSRSTERKMCQFSSILFIVKTNWGQDPVFPKVEFSRFILTLFEIRWLTSTFLSSTSWIQKISATIEFSRLKSTCFLRKSTSAGWCQLFLRHWFFCTKIAHRPFFAILTSAGWTHENSTSACVNASTLPLLHPCLSPWRYKLFSAKQLPAAPWRQEDIAVHLGHYAMTHSSRIWFFGIFHKQVSARCVSHTLNECVGYSPFRGRWDLKCWIKW